MAASAAGVAVEYRPATAGTDPRLHAVRHGAASRSASDAASGVDLPRLLEITRLTPAQAVGIGADVLSALESLHAGGEARGGFGLDAVRIGTDGRTRLTGPAPSPDGTSTAPAEHHRGDLTAAGAMLAELTRAARRTARHPDQRSIDLLHALDRAAAGTAEPGADVAALAALLRDTDAASTRTRAELSGLVAAAGGRRPPPLPAPTAAPRPPAAPAVPPEGRLRAASRSVARRSWKWALSVVVLVAAILIEFTFLRDHIIRDVRLVLDAGRSGTTTAPATVAPVVPPAPAAAGAVSGVDLRALGVCSPGRACEVRLLIRLQPRAQPQTVVWTFQVLDRCTGAAVAAPGGTLSVLPDGMGLTAVDTVPLPPGRALVVTAVTSHPASAASAPLLVPAAGSCRTSPPGAPA